MPTTTRGHSGGTSAAAYFWRRNAAWQRWIAALCPAGIGLALGWVEPVPAAVLGGVTLVVLEWLERRTLRRVNDDFTGPLHAAAEFIDKMRAGESVRIPDAGAQVVRNLVRRVNQSLSDSIENSQLSQAKLLSVEAAFDRIHAVIRTLVDGVTLVNGRREVVLANPAIREMLACSGSIEGRPVAEVVTGPIGRCVAEALDGLEAGQGGRIFSAVHVEDRIFDIEVMPVDLAGDSKNFGTLVVVHDITETYEVARLKDEFLSSVSHELRTPLTNIVAYVEILNRMTDQSPESHEFLDVIQSESERLHRLVDNVLEYSRIESGDGDYDPEDLCVGEVMRGALSVFAERADRRGVTLNCGVDSIARVRMDRGQLRSVFTNVLDNALKFSEEGATIRVDVRQDGDIVRVAIDDSGPGVPEAHREAVFERLTQIGDTLVDKPAGTGMGLSICRAILDSNGGSIHCEASELGGARFVIDLPALEPAPAGRS